MPIPRLLICLLLPLLPLLLAPNALAQQPTAVQVAPVEERAITIASRLVATLEPMVQTILAAEQAAILQERSFDEGQAVEKGDLLARLDDSLLRARVASSEAAVRSAQAELQRAVLIEQNLRRERERIGGLFRQGVANERENFEAINQHDRAVAAVTVSEANLAEREAAVEELELQVRKSQVFAPFAGVVNRRYVEVGQWVRQGDPVAELVQLDPLYVRTAVPEHLLGRVQKGMPATVTVDALARREFPAEVAEILPVANPESRTFFVRLRVDNADGLLRPGMFARATLSHSDAGTLMVPKDAVVRVGGQTMVVVADNGVARSVAVQLGASDETHQAVQGEGLSAGDLVVVRGNEGLMDGTPLMVQGGGPGGPAAGR